MLIERFADQRLGALARGLGLSPKAVPEVLFVHTENTGRSQLAAALMLDIGSARSVCDAFGGGIDRLLQELLEQAAPV